MTRLQAVDQGRLAYLQQDEDCPHPRGSDLAASWQLGWISQAIDSRDPIYRSGQLKPNERNPFNPDLDPLQYALFGLGQANPQITH